MANTTLSHQALRQQAHQASESALARGRPLLHSACARSQPASLPAHASAPQEEPGGSSSNPAAAPKGHQWEDLQDIVGGGGVYVFEAGGGSPIPVADAEKHGLCHGVANVHSRIAAWLGMVHGMRSDPQCGTEQA